METKHNLPKRPPTPAENKIENHINKIKNIDDIKNDNIILFEKVESKEAEELLKSKQVFFNICIFLAAIITFLVTFFTAYNDYKTSLKIGISFSYSIIAVTLGFAINYTCLKKYYDLLRLTRHNDKIRHEEKVKKAEQIRLQNLEKKQVTPKNVKKSVEEYNDIFDK